MGLRGKILSGFAIVILLFVAFLAFTILRINLVADSVSELQSKAPQFDDVIQKVNDLQNKVFPVFEGSNQLVKNLENVQQIFLATITEEDLDNLEGISKQSNDFSKITKSLLLKLSGNGREKIKSIETRFHKYVIDGSNIVRKFINGENVDLTSLGKDARELIQNLENIQKEKKEEMDMTMGKISEINRKFKNDLFAITSSINIQILKLNRTIPVITIVALIAGIMIAFFLTKYVVIKPLNKTVNMIQELEKGNLQNRLNMSQRDEIGQMANAMDNFADKLNETIGEISDNARTLAGSASQLDGVSKRMETDADSMSHLANAVAEKSKKMTLNISAVAKAAENATGSINYVASSIKQMSVNMLNISVTTEQVTSNANTVAVSIEEMSSTVSEISKNTIMAANISEQASEKAKDAQTLMKNLGKSAKSVGKVIEVINDIADRTNLLALNATIEAASAGEAGKGFAVVANEVKELAKQTAEATEEIARQIEEMQESTNSTVQSMTDISTIINEINTINSTIASAVEEQDATTNEVSKTTALAVKALEEVKINVEKAASTTKELAQRAEGLSSNVIAEISKNATDTSLSATEVSVKIQEVKNSSDHNLADAKKISGNSNELSRLSQNLQSLVNQFTLVSLKEDPATVGTTTSDKTKQLENEKPDRA